MGFLCVQIGDFVAGDFFGDLNPRLLRLFDQDLDTFFEFVSGLDQVCLGDSLFDGDQGEILPLLPQAGPFAPISELSQAVHDLLLSKIYTPDSLTNSGQTRSAQLVTSFLSIPITLLHEVSSLFLTQ